MHKFHYLVFFIGIIVWGVNPTWAFDRQYLDSLEQKIAGQSYTVEPDEVRFTRMEEILFGKKSVGTFDERFIKITRFFTTHPSFQSEQETVDVNLSNPSNSLSTMSTVDSNHEDGSESDYPIISLLEQKIFHTHFAGDTTDTRLSRLENEIYKITFAHKSLYERVDQLKKTVFSDDVPVVNENGGRDDYHIYSDVHSVQEPQQLKEDDFIDIGSGAVSKENLSLAVAHLENKLLSTSFPFEMLTQRIDRLEQKVFNKTSSDLPESDRIERLAAVISADGTVSDEKNVSRMQNARRAQRGIMFGNLLLYLLLGLL